VYHEGEQQKPTHIVLKTQVVSLRPNHVTISEPHPEVGITSTEIPFDYAIYALGAHLPAPLDLWGRDPRVSVKAVDQKPWAYNGFKTDGTLWLRERQKVIEAAPTVLVVGGGALGIRTYPPHILLALSAYCLF
jgi:NADH dehydrogenase FAD-containing subunit